MDRYIGDIITHERHDSRNGDTDAHSDLQFVRYNQYAQDRLFGLITLSYNWAFEESILISPVADQSDYEINDNLAFGTRITNVEYSPNNDGKYYPIPVTPNRYDDLIRSGKPIFYKRRHGRIVIIPTPTTTAGMFRATYERSLDRLALRVGRINGTPSSTDIDLTHSSGAPTTDDEALFVENTYICISDAFGEPLLYNGIISAYDAGTDVITLTGDVEDYLVAGRTLADLADAYVTLGKYTTTHSKLPNEAENFFVEWVNRKLHNVDSSTQFDETDVILREIKDTIVASFKFPDKARKQFPIQDFNMLIPGYD